MKSEDTKRMTNSAADDLDSESLKYHRLPFPGKLNIIPSKPCGNSRDLSLAYSPGVAAPCIEISTRPDSIYDYTSKGNTVAVISDGTAVLGLGKIGPEAALPVMEGKAVLFKRFAGINAIGLCISDILGSDDYPGNLIETVKRLEPAFGGINLEDIAAPQCFEIERELCAEMDIPVFHDDQPGTAIICTAALLNSLEIVGKKIQDARIVVNGAGAAGLTCAEMCLLAGASKGNVTVCDSRGIINQDRPGLDGLKLEFASPRQGGLADAMKDADVFLGLSVGGCVSAEMIRSMNKKPIVFAMANPTPEIMPLEALKADTEIVATGRSDFPNQVNNVLGFPGIFRGALDVRASVINTEMKLAAVRALAELAGEEIKDCDMQCLEKAYPEECRKGIFEGKKPLKPEYVIPRPFDPRVVPRVARMVAEAAVRTGTARKNIDDFAGYEKAVRQMIDSDNV